MTGLDITLERRRLETLRDEAVMVRERAALFAVAGPGALPCVQGLLTNDVAAAEHALIYGALLTPKGMIVVDTWVIRLPERFLLLAPRQARDTAAAVFARSLPPRLARAEDRTDALEVLWLLGPRAAAAAVAAGVPLPDAPGRAREGDGPDGVVAALGPETAPFTALLVAPPEALDRIAGRMAEYGVAAGSTAELAAARILAGWPALGAEIDERTLPQEVRFDEIGGVSYTKGCYTGQETVARLHFRGHTNRSLRGLVWHEPPGELGEERAIRRDTRLVGTVRSTLTVGRRRIGLAPVRREVEPGEEVMVDGQRVTVVDLPFGTDALA